MLKRYFPILLVLTLTLLSLGCVGPSTGPGGEPPGNGTESYLPLALENYWKYQWEIVDYKQTLKIEKTEDIGGQSVFFYYYATAYPIYCNSEGIYRGKTRIPTNLDDFYRIAKLPFVVGEEYTISGNAWWEHILPVGEEDYETTVKVISTSETISTSAADFNGCVKLEYFIHSLGEGTGSDTKWICWLAPGVGLVKEDHYNFISPPSDPFDDPEDPEWIGGPYRTLIEYSLN